MTADEGLARLVRKPQDPSPKAVSLYALHAKHTVKRQLKIHTCLHA